MIKSNRIVFTKIGLLTQIYITDDKVNMVFTESDYIKCYLHVADYLQDILYQVDEYITLNNLQGTIVATKMGIVENEIIYKFMVNNKSIGLFIIPIKLITRDEYLAKFNKKSNITNRLIYEDSDGIKHECIPTEHAIKRFARRYCFASDIRFDSYRGMMLNMISIFNASKKYTNHHVKIRNEKYKEDSTYLRYSYDGTTTTHNRFVSFNWVLNPNTYEIITFELGGQHRDNNDKY